MALSRGYSPRLLLGGIFLIMLALAGIIEVTGSDMAGRILVILIPVGGVVLGVDSAIEAKSKIEIALAIILTLSASAATILAVIGAGPFSNLIVDVAIIGSIAGISFHQPLQTTIESVQRFVN
jgi:hypothetical protein